MDKYYIDGYNLTMSDVKNIIENNLIVEIADEAVERCRKSRKQINKWLEKDAPVVYGINTGLGNLKDVVMPPEDHIKWNKTIPYPHAAGFGEYLSSIITRTALLLRANILCRAYSAVRVELINRMLDIFNARISPAIYGLGSTGLSDLPPLSQSVMAVAGLEDAKVFYNDKVMGAREAYSKAGINETFDLECKEVLAQMNGSTMTQSIAVISFLKFESLYEKYLCIVEKSNDMLIKRQEAYEEMIRFAKDILNKENNISCDNPLLFEKEDGSYEAVMGCNCSNTQVGYVLDLLSIIIAEISSDIILKVKDTSIVKKNKAYYLNKELKSLCMQVSADSIPTKAGQEDHVEFSYTAARKFEQGVNILESLQEIVL